MKKLVTAAIMLLTLLAPTAAQAVTTYESNAAWCWFQDPRSIYHANKTYWTWNKTNGDVGVSAVSAAGSATGTLRSGLQYDDHAVPALLGFPDGRVAAFYSAHGGSKMYYRKTVSPAGVSNWNSEQYLPFGAPQGPNAYGYTYPNPVYLSGEGGGKTYLFFRFHGQDPTLTTNIDDALPDFKWTAPRKFFRSSFRPYVKVASDGVDTIWFAITDGHPLNVVENNIYVFYYKAGNWYRPDDSLIRSSSQIADFPITPAELGDTARVYDATDTGLKSWVWDIALDENEDPVVVYSDFPNQNDHRYHYAKWNGSSWDDQEIAQGGASIEENGNEPWYSGGIVLDHDDTDTLYTSEQVGTDRWDIKQYHWNGATWGVTGITSSGKNFRPVVPRNHSAGGLDVLWMEGSYPSFTSFATDYLGKP